MAIPRTQRGGWPYSQPPNVPFELNKDSPQAKGLMAWWPMLASRGMIGPVRDLADGRFPMPQFNSPAWVNDRERGATLLFDDVATEYLGISQAVLTGPPFTFSGWFNSDSLTANQAIVAIGDADQFSYHSLSLRGDQPGDFAVMASFFAGIGQAASAIAYSTGIWQHVCGTVVSNTERHVWLNGANKGSNVASKNVTGLDSTAIGRITMSVNTGYMSGMLDDIRIYNRALNDAEVYELYRNPWELYKPLAQRLFTRSPVIARIPRPPAAYNQLAIY